MDEKLLPTRPETVNKNPIFSISIAEHSSLFITTKSAESTTKDSCICVSCRSLFLPSPTQSPVSNQEKENQETRHNQLYVYLMHLLVYVYDDGDMEAGEDVASWHSLLRIKRSIRKIPRSSVVLRTRQNGIRLLQCRDFLLAGRLADLEVSHDKITTLLHCGLSAVEVRTFLFESVERRGLLAQTDLISGLFLCLVDDAALLLLDGIVRRCHELLVRLLRFVFRCEGLSLHGFGISDDLLNQGQDARTCGILLVLFETRWRRLPLYQSSSVNTLQNGERLSQDILSLPLIRHGCLKLDAGCATVLTETLQLHLQVGDLLSECGRSLLSVSVCDSAGT